jgi:hypothetical protein
MRCSKEADEVSPHGTGATSTFTGGRTPGVRGAFHQARHQPYGDVYGAWRAMEELHREGRVRAIERSQRELPEVVERETVVKLLGRGARPELGLL